MTSGEQPKEDWTQKVDEQANEEVVEVPIEAEGIKTYKRPSMKKKKKILVYDEIKSTNAQLNASESKNLKSASKDQNASQPSVTTMKTASQIKE